MKCNKKTNKIFSMTSLIIVGLVTLSVLLLFFASIYAHKIGVFKVMKQVLNGTSPLLEKNQITTVTEKYVAPEDTYNFNMNSFFAKPEYIKGIYFLPGVDWLSENEHSFDKVKQDIDSAFSTLKSNGFNTIFVPLSYKDKSLYKSDILSNYIEIKDKDNNIFDVTSYITQTARKNGIYVYGILNMRMQTANGWDTTSSLSKQAMINYAKEAVNNCNFDGYLLSGIGYSENHTASYSNFINNMPANDFNAFVRQSITSSVNDIVQAIKSIDYDLFVGMLTQPVWTTTSYPDMQVDIIQLINKEVFDFFVVDTSCLDDNSLTSDFKTILTWWENALKDTDYSLYIYHNNQTFDFTANQILLCNQSSVCKRSILKDFSAFSQTNNTQYVQDIKLALNNSYPENSDSLVINSLQNVSSVTTKSKITLTGVSNNTQLFLNKKKINVLDNSSFFVDAELQIGINTFELSNSTNSISFSIKRVSLPVHSINPKQIQRVKGKSKLTINAVAKKNSSVIAVINNNEYSMSPIPQDDDSNDLLDINQIQDGYQQYSYEYETPDSTEGIDLPLGEVFITANHEGVVKSVRGGFITVMAKPVNNKNISPLPAPENLKDIDPENGSGSKISNGKLIIMNADYGETFDANTSNSVSRVTNAYMPYGTIDVVTEEVGSYYLLGCGRRCLKSDVKLYKNSGVLRANALKETKTIISDYDTKIHINSDWRVPYSFEFSPQEYEQKSGQNLDAIESFTAKYIDITFYHTSKATKSIHVTDSPLFKSAKWIGGENNTIILRLELKSIGGFYGYSVYWDNDGIVFSFSNPSNISNNSKPLSGKRIVLDPGHGGPSTGTISGNFIEKDWVLTYSNSLQQQLEDLGAKVILTRTTDVMVDKERSPQSLSARNAYARNNYTDLFISIHVDSAGSKESNARGSTVYYFNEYSFDFAKSVGTSCKNAYEKYVPGAYNRNGLGYYKQRFMVTQIHDCPSILVECGFASNSSEVKLMRSLEYKDWFTQSIIDGIINYFKERPVS